ncbi:hypothetical protein EYF80_052897 [Liparis tanakae]|uniref:Uncharacterized protein n=1 Tax=Liparis tanakae TaxID=230148 RepID=A0A4Z2F7T8_9TELE|nr:hypothetical protein EYF80_052897 [Liparis tanakae]
MIPKSPDFTDTPPGVVHGRGVTWFLGDGHLGVLLMFSSTRSLSSCVSRILHCSIISFCSYCSFSVCSRRWLFSSSSISFCLMAISQSESSELSSTSISSSSSSSSSSSPPSSWSLPSRTSCKTTGSRVNINIHTTHVVGIVGMEAGGGGRTMSASSWPRSALSFSEPFSCSLSGTSSLTALEHSDTRGRVSGGGGPAPRQEACLQKHRRFSRSFLASSMMSDVSFSGASSDGAPYSDWRLEARDRFFLKFSFTASLSRRAHEGYRGNPPALASTWLAWSLSTCVSRALCASMVSCMAFTLTLRLPFSVCSIEFSWNMSLKLSTPSSPDSRLPCGGTDGGRGEGQLLLRHHSICRRAISVLNTLICWLALSWFTITLFLMFRARLAYFSAFSVSMKSRSDGLMQAIITVWLRGGSFTNVYELYV